MRKPVRKKENAPKKTKRERLSQMLDVPLDVVADVPRFTLNDNRELSIENYKSIEGYEKTEIVLRAKQYRIRILGENLEIMAITDQEIVIHGIITSLSLL